MRRPSVVYQVYPRSFQDSDGDGVGDLRGIARRLDHVQRLGADALWLSPIYPSPLADGGYDIADFCDVDRRLGSLADLDALVAAAHARGLALLLDLVPNHTSIEHPWFRAHPDRYVWADAPANNWRAAFGGPAWTRDPHSGRFYLHSFYPEQPDLDWRNPEVVRALQDVVRFWRARGVDGFRVDAVDRLGKDPELRDDPPARRPPPLPLHPELAGLERVLSIGDLRAVRPALAALREAAGDGFLIGEVFVPTAELGPYLEHLDTAFVFELLFAPWRGDALAETIARALAAGPVSWMLSNHDFPRLVTRIGRDGARVAAMLLLTLPGCAFVYQGDEIGLADGPGGDPPLDRHGRDGARHPMQWDATPNGGFTDGAPWLPAVDPERTNVADQERDPGSLLWLYRRLIALRGRLTGELRVVEADEDVLVYARGAHVVALNLGDEQRPLPAGEVVLATAGEHGALAPRSGAVIRL